MTESEKEFRDITRTDIFGRRYDLSYKEAYELFLTKGYGIRRSVWPSFQFIWWPKTIQVTKDCFLADVDPAMKFAVSLIGGETPMDLGPLQFRLFLNKENRMESQIVGGYIFSKEDEDANDWEEFFIPQRSEPSVTSKSIS